jgi:hypothetical protein
VVLVGNRQDGRETAEHVTRVGPEGGRILGAIRDQLAHGRYPRSQLYGQGAAAEQIAARLAEVPIYHQKRLGYVRDEPAAPLARPLRPAATPLAPEEAVAVGRRPRS